MRIKIGILQTTIDVDHRADNFSRAREQISSAMADRCDLLILPELWYSGFQYHEMNRITEETKSLFSSLKKYCDQSKVTLAGSYLTRKGPAYQNTLLLIGSGPRKYRPYHKIHLMPELKEDAHFVRGRRLVKNPIGLFNLGSVICFDLRFSRMFHKLRNLGVNAFILPAQWPRQRLDHWNVLLKARAIETQSYVLAANGVGKSGKITLGGASQIIDPWGNILALAGSEKSENITCSIDSDVVEKYRKSFPLPRE